MAKKYITHKSEDYAIVDKHTDDLYAYNQTRKVTLDEFIMVYFSSYPEIMSLEGQKLKVLMACWKYSTFGSDGTNGNIMVNNKAFKQHVREYEPNISDAAIDVAISTLAKKNLLIKMCKGQYELNHDYFFKGTLNERSKLMLKVEYDPDKPPQMRTETTKDGKKAFCLFAYAKSIGLVNAEDEGLDGELPK